MTEAQRPAAGKHVSFSQLSRQCGLALKFYRERLPADHRNIALIYGSALHVGLETYGQAKIRQRIEGTPEPLPSSDHSPLSKAIVAAQAYLRHEVEDAEVSGNTPIRWDLEPQLTKPTKKDPDGHPYADQRGQIHRIETADAMLYMHLREFDKKFGGMLFALTERKVELKLSRPAGWVSRGTIDAITEDADIVDYKTANAPWDHKKLSGYLAQAYGYQAAFVQEFGEAPRSFRFIVFCKGEMRIQEFNVPYDPVAINQYLELVVRPTIRSIEADIFVPRTDGWWCSEKFCDFWAHCPLGAARQPDAVAA